MPTVSIDLAPEEPVLDGRHLGTIIERWLEQCAIRLPKRSLVGYAEKVKFFQEWWARTGPTQNWELRQIDLQRFNRDLAAIAHKRTGKPLEYNTRKDVLRRLRSALLWAFRKGYTRHLNCSLWVPAQPDGSARLHLPLTIEQLARLMWTAAGMPFAVRNQAILAVFIGTGARLAEVAGLSVEDITLFADHSGTLRIRQAKKVKNREIHERLACFDYHAGKYINRWLDYRNVASGPLWTSFRGTKLTSQGVYKAVREVALAAEVNLTGVHDFRRTFTTYFADRRPGEGYYHLLKMQIGHAPQGVTHSLYDLRSIESVRAAFVSPFEDITPLLIGMSRT